MKLVVLLLGLETWKVKIEINLFPIVKLKRQVDENTERSKKTASKLLRTALERDPVVWETRYAVTYSIEHAGHANVRSGKNAAAVKICIQTQQIMTPAFLFFTETDATSESGLPPRKRARKADLRKKCIRLTEQLMDSVEAVEDQRTLEKLSQVLGSLLKELVPLSSSVDRKPFHLEAKTLDGLSPLSQRCLGRQKQTIGLDSLTNSMQEPPC